MAKPKELKRTQMDVDKVRKLYSLKPTFVTGCYLTPLLQPKSTVIRAVFTEYSQDLAADLPSVAIAITVEDLQLIYNAMTTLLQNMRTMGRIE